MVAVAVASAAAACSGGGAGGAPGGSDGGGAPSAAPAPSGNDASLADCDRQAESVAVSVCGSAYEELWTCPAGHAKPTGCALSTARDSFCCPLTPPPECTSYCMVAAACAKDTPERCATVCATDLEFVEQLDFECREAATAYLRCVATAGGSECRDGTPFIASCEKTGEALIKCQTKGSFVRSPESDSKCAAEKLPSRAYLATSYGYAPSCYSFDGDKTLTPGELMCCRYP